MRTLVAIAWRNVLRQRRRSLLTAGAMGIAVAFLMVVLALTEGMYGQMRDVLVTRNLGHVQVHPEAWPGRRQLHDAFEDVDALVADLEERPGVRAVAARLYGNALLGSAARTDGAQLVGVDPAREDAQRALSEDVVAGGWLPASAEGAVVLGADLADRLSVAVGDELVAVTQAADGSLGNELFTVTGVVRTGSPSVDRAGAFLHRADLSRLLALDDRAHELVVLGTDDGHDTVKALAAALRPVLDGRAALVRTWWEVDPGLFQLFQMQGVSTWILIGFFFGVSAIGVINTLLMSVFERTRELGVMRAIGMRPRQLVALVVLESTMLAVLAVVGGAALGVVGDVLLVTQGIDFTVGGQGYEMGDMTFDPIIKGRVTLASVWQPVVGVLLFSLLAAVWPALRASRLKPIDAIREV